MDVRKTGLRDHLRRGKGGWVAKKAYASQEEALAVVAQNTEWGAYKCGTCAAWHVGHKKA